MMKKQHGLSIVELLIGLVMGLIILLGASHLFSWNLGSNMNSVKQQRLEQTVQIVSDMIAGDIRRAGYASAGVTLTAQSGGGHYFANTSCVLMSNSTASANERFRGYKLVSEILYRYDGAANASCDANVTGWDAMTDVTYVRVTMLRFDQGAVDLAYDCSAAPVAGTPGIERVSLGVEAVGLDISSGNPVKRCVQFNVHRRNT